ncbi:MAG: hypothetical protein ACE5ER_02200, partial [Nitrospinaceae bacterium]
VMDNLLPANPAPRDLHGNDIVYALNVGTTMLERTSNGVTTQVTSGITGLSITEIFPNLYRIQMTMTGPGGGNFALDSAVRVRSSINPPTSTSLQVALVVRNPGNLDVNRDVPVLTYMQSNLQHIVTLKDDNDQTWDPVVDGYSAVVISSSVLRRKVGWLAPFNVGILTLHGNTFNTFSLGTGGATFGPVNSTDIVVQNPTHYIMQVPPFSSGGTHTIYTNADNSGHMQGWSNGVTALATHQPNATRGRLLVVDAGALLVNGNPAPSRRAYFAARFFANLNTDGQELFKRSLEWVTQ